MPSKIACLPVLVAFLLALAGCAGEPTAKPRKLVITGSSTVAPLVADIAKQFEKQRPGVRIDVQTGGSSRGLSDARQGLADLGMVSRSPKPGEDDLEWFALARDGLAVIVHADNPLQHLSEEQVAAIFRGELTDWSQVGGDDAPITVISKADGRSTLEVFLQHFGLASPEIKASVIIGDNQQGLKTVAGNPDAIGYVSIGAAELEANRGVPIKLVALGERVPSTRAVRENAYPIARTLHLVSAGTPVGLAAEFLDYCRSPDVHGLVEGQSLVPLAG